ncbi:MAG: hypothetical protein AB1507_01790 [Bacillota bacterium]|nr:hypothetical protein [Thermoanaerobacteraceae bacterium]
MPKKHLSGLRGEALKDRLVWRDRDAWWRKPVITVHETACTTLFKAAGCVL